MENKTSVALAGSGAGLPVVPALEESGNVIIVGNDASDQAALELNTQPAQPEPHVLNSAQDKGEV